MTTPWFHILSGLSGLDSTQLLRYPQNPIPLKIPLYPNCFGTTCCRWGNTGCLTKAELRLCCIQVLGGLSFPGGKQRKWPFGHPQGHGSFLLNCILSFCFILEKEKKTTTQKSALSLILLCSPHQPNVDGVMEKGQKGRHGLDTQGMQRERERAHESMYSPKMGTPMGLRSPIQWIFL